MHPYFLRYRDYIADRFSCKDELLAFLAMVKLKEARLRWALKQKDKKNGYLAFVCGIKIRRFQQLKADTWYNNRIHLGLNRREGVTPDEAIVRKLRPESLLGLFFRMVDGK